MPEELSDVDLLRINIRAKDRYIIELKEVAGKIATGHDAFVTRLKATFAPGEEDGAIARVIDRIEAETWGQR